MSDEPEAQDDDDLPSSPPPIGTDDNAVTEPEAKEPVEADPEAKEPEAKEPKPKPKPKRKSRAKKKTETATEPTKGDDAPENSEPVEETESSKKDKHRKRAKEEEKKSAMSDYDRHMREVKKVKEMTDTLGWQEHYRYLVNLKKMHTMALEDAEKTREIVQHQEAIKLIKRQIEKVAEPVKELDAFISTMSLFVQHMKERAEFRPESGRIILIEVD